MLCLKHYNQKWACAYQVNCHLLPTHSLTRFSSGLAFGIITMEYNRRPWIKERSGRMRADVLLTKRGPLGRDSPILLRPNLDLEMDRVASYYFIISDYNLCYLETGHKVICLSLYHCINRLAQGQDSTSVTPCCSLSSLF